MHYFSNLFDKVLYMFLTGVSQHCIHTIGICHASSGGCLLACQDGSILTTLADSQQRGQDGTIDHASKQPTELA
jgi:hypothetical protein